MDVSGHHGDWPFGRILGKQMENHGNGDWMEIQRLLRKTITMQIAEIERVKIGKKSQMVLYHNGKKLITIDCLTDNSELLYESLKRHKKIC